MKLSKTKTILTAVLFGGMLLANAQENARKGWDAPPPKSHISVGFGSTMPSSSTKDAFFTNSSGITLDYSVPLAKRGWGPNGNYLSLNIGGQYNFGGSSDPSVSLPSEFAIAGQTSSSIAYKGVDPKNPGFFTFVGPQVNFNLSNKFTISPMLLAGYLTMTQKELSAVQTTQYNGQTLEYKLVTLPETKTSGFAVTPKIRMQYRLTKSLGLFADASYIFGPKVETQLSTLVPLGNPNQQGQYNQQQLEMGTYVKGETKTTSYTALGVNIGLSFAFGKSKKGWNGVAQSEYKGWNGVTERTKMTKADSGVKPPYSPMDPNPKPGDEFKSLSFMNDVCHLKPQCDNGGVLCVSSSVSTTNIGENQILTKVNIIKNGTKIIITSDAICGTISQTNIEKFKNHKVPLVATDIPFESMKILFESIGLSCPTNLNEFSEKEISYNVSQNNVIEIVQSKSMLIDNTTYNIQVITKLENRVLPTNLEFIINDKGNNAQIKKWVECNNGDQVQYVLENGTITSKSLGKACKGNWSSY